MEDNKTKRLRRISASQSFNEEEVGWMNELVTKLLSGGDTKMLVRAPVAARVIRKVRSMKAVIESAKKRKSASAILESTDP